MSFDFPNTPTEGDTFVAVTEGITFIYQNGKWMRKSDDAPVDGKLYGRKDMSWVEVAEHSFPDAPNDGNTWARKNNGWVEVVGTTISDTIPLGPDQGQLWWNSVNGNLYIYYDDGTSAQWIQVNMVGT